MYEFHGWITIQVTASKAEQEQLEAIIPKIQLKITEYAWGSGLLSLNAACGCYYLHVGGFTKEKGPEADEILSLYRYIGRLPLDHTDCCIPGMTRIRKVRTTNFGCWCLRAGS